MAPGQPAPYQEKVDLSIKIPESLVRFTMGVIPQTPNMQAAAKVPVGGIIRPLAPPADGEDEIPTVQPSNAGIIRCKRYVKERYVAF